MRLDGCFWGQILLNSSFSKTAAKIYDLSYKFQVPHILHFLLWRQVKEERIFVDTLLGKGFREKCKHTEIAWNIIILVF